MTYDQVLALLDGVRRTGKGHVARCPAHDDKSPSLSLRGGDDGCVLLRCHAGCDTESVVTAIGLTMADLFPDDGKPRRPAPAPGVSRADLRRAADLERGILFIIQADRAKGRPINDVDKTRAQLARQRIAAARERGC